jgi:hypothetical protein
MAEVERWYREAIAAFEAEKDQVGQLQTRANLADVLRRDPTRLVEARALAEEALKIAETLDPRVAGIWKIHGFLATIAGQQGDAGDARRHDLAARQSLATAPIVKEALRHYRPLIDATLAVLRQKSGQQEAELERMLVEGAKRGRTDLVTALRALLAGARDEKALCARRSTTRTRW